MANWVHNIVTITGDKKVLEEIKALMIYTEKNGTVDEFCFDKLIPMPKELRLVAGGSEKELIALAKTKKGTKKREKALKDLHLPFYYLPDLGSDFYYNCPLYIRKEEEAEALGRRYIENINKYGVSNWYDWQAKNWGAKWGASDVSTHHTSDTLGYDFSTPWASPLPIFEELTRRFPVNLTCEAFFEDDNNFSYVLTFREGELTSEEAKKIA
jgi:hypothetical protein